MQVTLFSNSTKTASATNPMQATSDPYQDMDARSFSFRLCQTYTGEWLKVRGNATILSNGTLAASVEDIYNLSRKQYERWPYGQELKDAVEGRAAEYFLEEKRDTFCKHSILHQSISW
jgi:hypothetical protein